MIKLRRGDCQKLMLQIPDNSVDLVLTDMPYDVVNRTSNGLRNLDKKKADELRFNIQTVLEESLRACSGSFYIFCSTEQVSEVRGCLATNGLTTRLCVWEKTNPSPMNGQHVWLSGIECFVYGKKKKAVFNEHCKNTVFRYPVPRGKLHPTMKPLKLMEELILASSNPGDTVLDFAMGSVTTGVACVNTGRSFIGMELDPEFYKIACKRIAQASKG